MENNERLTRLRQLRARLMANHPGGLPGELRARSDTALHRLSESTGRLMRLRLQRLQGLGRTLHAISPLATVDRGYALLQDSAGKLVVSVEQVATGDSLNAKVSDGTLFLRITGTEKLP